MNRDTKTLSRRELVRLALAATALGVTGTSARRALGAEPAPTLQTVDPRERRLLFVVCAYGGASIIDSFLPVVDYENPDPLAASELNVFPDSMVEKRAGSNLRTPKLLDAYGIYAKPKFALGDLVAKHGADLAVITHEVSSVNHTVAQQRSLNGAGFDRGRTLMESVALRYGGGLPLPSCNMASDGYLRHGVDSSLPNEARHELITTPLLFGAGTHGYRGVAGAPTAALLDRARQTRDALESRSVFGRTFAADARRTRYLASRAKTAGELERAGLFEKLLLADPSKLGTSAGQIDPVTAQVRATLPDLERDSVEAQIALGFLMAYHGVSSSVTLGLPTNPYVTAAGDITGAPLAFDFSHNAHREVQSLMWCRTASLVDKLIDLLKTHDYLGDPSLGKMWDRSLVYIATEFGRDKKRPYLSNSWGTGHHLNNGSVILSPLVRGNAVYGGVDPTTCLTYGFDPISGAPTPGSVLNESDVYSIIAQALALDVPGARAFPAVVR
ncbi:MAG TPA: hypothetical protein VI299_14995 [Polyangiales bacterium]